MMPEATKARAFREIVTGQVVGERQTRQIGAATDGRGEKRQRTSPTLARTVTAKPSVGQRRVTAAPARTARIAASAQSPPTRAREGPDKILGWVSNQDGIRPYGRYVPFPYPQGTNNRF